MITLRRFAAQVLAATVALCTAHAGSAQTTLKVVMLWI